MPATPPSPEIRIEYAPGGSVRSKAESALPAGSGKAPTAVAAAVICTELALELQPALLAIRLLFPS